MQELLPDSRAKNPKGLIFNSPMGTLVPVFCANCGTPFLMKVDHQPETVDFSVVTLDRPEAVAPGFHIFWGSRVGWFDPKDDLPRYGKFRPDTRGLSGTEPPE